MERRHVLAGGLCLAFGGCLDGFGGSNGDLEDPESPPYETVPAADEVLERHETVLTDVGTAVRTIDREQDLETTTQSETLEQSRTTAFDFTVDPPHRHVTHEDGREVWYGPERTLVRTPMGEYYRQPESESSLFSAERELLDPITFEGPESIEGESTMFRYHVSGADALADGVVDEEVTITTLEATLDLRGDGLILRLALDYGLEGDGQSLSHDETIRYEDLGTPVQPPNWVATAREEVPPGPDETATVTRTMGDAEVRVTGTGRDVSEEYTVGPQLSRGESFSAAALSAAQVSCTVRVRLPERYDEAEITIPYEDEHVPDGDEAGLMLTRYVTSGTFTTLAGVDQDMNTATASIPGEGYYFVMHEPTYESAYRRGEELGSTPPPPECGL